MDVRRNEWPMLLGMGLFAFLAVAVAIVIRTWSDTVFLEHFDVAWLPLLFVLSAFAFAPALRGTFAGGPSAAASPSPPPPRSFAVASATLILLFSLSAAGCVG